MRLFFLRLSDGLYVEKRMICACSNTDICIYIECVKLFL